MVLRRVVNLVALSLAFAGLTTVSTQASTLTPDLSPVRAASEFSRSGDFDGDGRRDEVVLTDEADSGRLAVFVRLNTVEGFRDLRVTSLDAEDGVLPAVRVVPAGRYMPDCGNFVSDGCAAVVTHADGLILGLSSGTSVLMHWNGTSFDSDFVRDDQAEMARALSALFALNP